MNAPLVSTNGKPIAPSPMTDEEEGELFMNLLRQQQVT